MDENTEMEQTGSQSLRRIACPRPLSIEHGRIDESGNHLGLLGLRQWHYACPIKRMSTVSLTCDKKMV